MNYKVALTTIDNPYDYFEQFTSWLLFDKEQGYNTCEKIARLVNITDDMTQQEEDLAIEAAIDRLIELDFLNIYKKIKKQTGTDQ